MTTRKVLAFVLAAAFLAVFAVALGKGRPVPEIPAVQASPGAVMWGGRTLEILAQGAVLLGGVLGILALLAEPRGKGGAA